MCESTQKTPKGNTNYCGVFLVCFLVPSKSATKNKMGKENFLLFLVNTETTPKTKLT